MTIQATVTSYSDIKNLFSGMSFFNDSEPYREQLSMIYRSVGKMREIFLRGPLRDSKILLPPSEDDNGDKWPSPFTSSIISNLNKDNISFCTSLDKEGCTIWSLVPDSSIGKDLLPIIKNDIKGRRWATAFNTARQKTDTESPFAISFIASYTFNPIPFFGRVAYGIAMVDDVISLTQIPLLVSSNREQYFTWSFVSKLPITDKELISQYGNGGSEKNYSDFIKFREFLNSECEPLNPNGDYSFARGDASSNPKPSQNPDLEGDGQDNRQESDNTLTAHVNEESLIKSRNESLFRAEDFLYSGYSYIDEASSRRESSYKDDGVVSDARQSLPSGEPFINKIKKEAGIPIYGPLY